MTMPAGLHIVTIRRKGKPCIHYVYAWRGGPQILKKVGGAKPAITAELTDAASAVRKAEIRVDYADTIAGLIERFERSPEFGKLAASTQANHRTWFPRIRDEFGNAPLALFSDIRMRGEVLAWRGAWAHQPRSADAAKATFSALLSFAVRYGLLATNILHGSGSLYDCDRSDIIWEQRHFDQIRPHASVEVMEAIDLAAATGLRRGDLVRLPWSAITEHAIVWRTGKSGGRAQIVVPLLPETRAVLARIKARHAAEMAALPENKRKPLPETVLSNSRWEAWTPSGLGSRFNDAKQASGLEVNFHDIRGTFATYCMHAQLTDNEIAEIVGWKATDVARIRSKYVNSARVIIAIGERIAAAKGAA